MDDERETEIRHRAYLIWLAEGQPEGCSEEHWHRAAAEVGETSAPEPAEEAVSEKHPASPTR